MPAQQIQRQSPQDTEVTNTILTTNATTILSKHHIQRPMQKILNLSGFSGCGSGGNSWVTFEGIRPPTLDDQCHELTRDRFGLDEPG